MIVRKFPVEIRTVVVSFAHNLAPDDSLLPGAVVTSADPAVTAVLVSTAETSVSVRVSGCLARTSYRVAVKVPTAHGDLLEQDVVVEIAGDPDL
jgi:hypothetical protein